MRSKGSISKVVIGLFILQNTRPPTLATLLHPCLWKNSPPTQNVTSLNDDD